MLSVNLSQHSRELASSPARMQAQSSCAYGLTPAYGFALELEFIPAGSFARDADGMPRVTPTIIAPAASRPAGRGRAKGAGLAESA